MKSRDKVRSKTLPRTDQPIKMRVAAALVYHQITGKTRNAASEPEYEVALADSAIALSQIADIFYVNGEGRLARIPEDELALGKFEQSGDVYRARSGQVYRDVTLLRADVMDAVVLLTKAREAIDGATDEQGGTESATG